MSMPSPPSYVFAQEERILQDMMSVSGISDVNLGQTHHQELNQVGQWHC